MKVKRLLYQDRESGILLNVKFIEHYIKYMTESDTEMQEVLSSVEIVTEGGQQCFVPDSTDDSVISLLVPNGVRTLVRVK